MSFSRDDYLGLAAGEAEELARAQGWQVRRLRPGHMATMDFRDDRLNLLLDESDIVTDVTLG
ncbi:I78 family peptidase inhibitor [Nocardioides aequoreus]|uniref:I78 family peptidase inhibitor n=1 Tax=Nocardioides aequoreus TaxID=397278 RepID=UPI0004C4799D|nr:I78 family peptidase inhibitor [Nocardioides aequoreus]